MMCIKKKRLAELLDKFPLIKDFYETRAKQRRVEFRRVSLVNYIYCAHFTFYRSREYTWKCKTWEVTLKTMIRL